MAAGQSAVDAGLFAARAHDIIDAGRFLDAHGWAPATAGNYSARLDAAHFAITVSGCHKGRLAEQDVMAVDLAGLPVGSAKKASAETLLHAQLLADFPAIGAVLHTHSVASTVLSMVDPQRSEIAFTDYELVKAFDGYDTHEATAVVPIFENSQDMKALSAQVQAYMRRHPPMLAAVLDTATGQAGILGYLIRGHGVYTWGADMAAAKRHAEALEFLFACELERLRIGR
jgi:methylthioribulose-1-phosphate dehydratase